MWTLDLNDLGSLSRALAERFPNDRMNHTHFQRDFNYSRYSYEEFYDIIANNPDPAQAKELTLAFPSNLK